MSDIKQSVGKWPGYHGLKTDISDVDKDLAVKCIERNALNDADRAELLAMLGLDGAE